MGSEWIIGALALITIGGTLALAVFHFGFHLKDPNNMDAVKRVAADRESATTRMASEGTKGRSLRERLDAAPKVDERRGRPTGLAPLDVLLSSKWSDLRPALNARASDR